MLYISIVNIIQHGIPLTKDVDKKNNHPHILRFVDGDEVIPPQYVIAGEQDVVMEYRNFTSALYHLISTTHYIFNISYNVTVKNVLFFIQRKFASFDDKSLLSTCLLNLVLNVIWTNNFPFYMVYVAPFC